MKAILTLSLWWTLLAACSYELARDDTLRVAIEDEDAQPFLADGVSQRTVTISFDGDVTAGKVLTATTSLGIINPSATGGAQRTLSLKTTNGSPINFQLYAERTDGAGQLVVDGPDGARAIADFVLTPVAEMLRMNVPSGRHVADGTGGPKLTIELVSANPRLRDVVVTTSLGILSPEKQGDAARSRTVRVSPSQAAQLTLLAGSTAGTAVVTAQADGMLETTSVVLEAADRRMDLHASVAVASANGQDVVQLQLTCDAPPNEVNVTTLTTTLGELNPAGATNEARRTVTISLLGGRTISVPLNVGRVAGQANIVARSSSTSDEIETIVLRQALPDRVALEIVDSSVLDAVRSQTSIRALVARNLGRGRVSVGTPIELLSCCDEGAGVRECDDLLSVPSFVNDDDGDGRETAVVSLTPSGKAFVNTLASQANVDIDAVLYAFVRELDDGISVTCDTIASDDGTIVAIDSVGLALTRARPPADP